MADKYEFTANVVEQTGGASASSAYTVIQSNASIGATITGQVIGGGAGPQGDTPVKGVDYFDGKEVELQTTATHIQWRLTGEAWTNLVELSSLKGDRGDAGADSVVPGPANTLSIGSVTEGAAAASITGAAPTQTLNLTLPRGNAGADGYNPMTVSATPPLGASIGDLWYQP